MGLVPGDRQERELAILTDVESAARAQSDRSENLIPKVVRVPTCVVLGAVRKQLPRTGFDASSLCHYSDPHKCHSSDIFVQVGKCSF